MLFLAGSKVIDLTPLADLSALVHLNLDRTDVSDLHPLSKLPNLYELSLHATKVSDLRPLEGITSLRSLKIERSQVTPEEIDRFKLTRPNVAVNPPTN